MTGGIIIRAYLARTLLVLASLALAATLWELGLSLKYRLEGKRGSSVLVEEYQSPYIFKLTPGQSSNNFSMRRNEDISEMPTPGTVRILSYGDSIGGGYRVGDDETYTARLEEALNRDGRGRYEVLNMSRGHSPTIYSFHIRRDVPQFSPAAVIVEIELLNDTSDEAHAATSGVDSDGLPLRIHRYRYIMTWEGQLLAPMTVSGSWIERTKLYAKLTRYLGRFLTRWAANPIFADDSDVYYYSSRSDRWFLTEEVLERGFDRMFDALAGIQNYLQRRGIDFLVLLVPSQYVYDEGPYGTSALVALRRAEGRAAALGLPFTSLYETTASNGGAELYMDFCHPTADGHRVIADALYAAVRERGLVPTGVNLGGQ